MFVAPERAMSSAVITKIAEAVRESVCSLFETEVTSTFIRSSRLFVVRSVEFCCGHAGIARNAKINRHRSTRPAKRHSRRQKVWQGPWRPSVPIGFPLMWLHCYIGDFSSLKAIRITEGHLSTLVQVLISYSVWFKI